MLMTILAHYDSGSTYTLTDLLVIFGGAALVFIVIGVFMYFTRETSPLDRNR